MKFSTLTASLTLMTLALAGSIAEEFRHRDINGPVRTLRHRLSRTFLGIPAVERSLVIERLPIQQLYKQGQISNSWKRAVDAYTSGISHQFKQMVMLIGRWEEVVEAQPNLNDSHITAEEMAELLVQADRLVIQSSYTWLALTYWDQLNSAAPVPEANTAVAEFSDEYANIRRHWKHVDFGALTVTQRRAAFPMLALTDVLSPSNLATFVVNLLNKSSNDSAWATAVPEAYQTFAQAVRQSNSPSVLEPERPYAFFTLRAILAAYAIAGKARSMLEFADLFNDPESRPLQLYALAYILACETAQWDVASAIRDDPRRKLLFKTTPTRFIAELKAYGYAETLAHYQNFAQVSDVAAIQPSSEMALFYPLFTFTDGRLGIQVRSDDLERIIGDSVTYIPEDQIPNQNQGTDGVASA
ncbi:hypothetical protein H4R33_002536 [Dimargaris cristalligena]|uniref:Uncharacterized protein n=1 Tax=Dimargaris cristalligena TaxID=215637 RepID=A0A4P9ZYB6_9FUNG|nr:hypothetical protein H4R33_002536 [Dimargaris cristalligena]RKP38683.1 hypothetical protein BJ085DRAFT_41366 [Dimargaris cristalligena]|eukprot:RKP38683.1 hypothetical protein BJ085DRAFT_41366 [Dimargaris cristalligena]